METSSFMETVFPGGLKYRVLFSVRGSSTVLMVKVATSLSFIKTPKRDVQVAKFKLQPIRKRLTMAQNQVNWKKNERINIFGSSSQAKTLIKMRPLTFPSPKMVTLSRGGA